MNNILIYELYPVTLSNRWELQTTWPIRFHIQLYRNSEEQHDAGLTEAKFGAKYLKTCATKYAPQQLHVTVEIVISQYITKNNLHTHCEIEKYYLSKDLNLKLI